jgi:Fic family protein
MGDLFDFLMMRARQENVVIAGAEHRPPSFLKIPEKMTALMDDYKQFSSCHAVESAARLHVDFVGIHPFVDGNGRTSRLLMNFELLRRGYLPVIIPVEGRLAYYEALDNAHVDGNYAPFIELVAQLERATLKRYLEVILGE